MVMAVLIWDGLDQDEARRVYREVAGTELTCESRCWLDIF